MKLGEAKRRLTQIDRRLQEYVLILGRGPQNGVISALSECNSLLQERMSLENRMSNTEAITELEGNSLTTVQAAYQTILRRMEFLNILVNRDDLDNNLRNSLFEQMEIFKESRDNLEKGIETCLWETDLLDE